ncbi:RNA polymerase subunit sigma [Roseiconus nitratireducens]|uniref:RNA polymerase subunit sigma n=1 Tax=Roseiconus nitratireducens TaxID=2605748 RepID=A0A5M6D8F6_9BACT|nr:ECF-type sigma factor [Roseiconus nitratireducens]KAA5541455.1 RNA polymerase subunit sigma [Roseiconus nitratireducens]
MLRITQILERIESGDDQAAEQLLPIVYDELRRLARAKMSLERPDHTLQTTALVHEAYVRLVDQNQVQRWENAGHFYAAAAEAMRRILVEHARRKLGKQRGGDRAKVDLKDDFGGKMTNPELVMDVHESLEKLAAHDPQISQLVKLHCFAGFSVPEAAKLLGIPTSSAYHHWNYAKALMARMLA